MKSPSKTQEAIILRTLRAAKGAWVPMPHLVTESGSLAVHSRIAELRKEGHKIENQIQHVDDRRRSSYRLLEEVQP